MRVFITATLCVLLVLSHLGKGVVLCFGGDGHVAIETAGDGKCCQDRSNPTPGVNFFVADATGGGCGVCSDVRLGGASVRTVTPTRLRDTATQVAVDVASPKINFESINVSRRVLCPRRTLSISTTPLSHLRTVTLLT